MLSCPPAAQVVLECANTGGWQPDNLAVDDLQAGTRYRWQCLQEFGPRCSVMEWEAGAQEGEAQGLQQLEGPPLSGQAGQPDKQKYIVTLDTGAGKGEGC